jgi:hypothetical protein
MLKKEMKEMLANPQSTIPKKNGMVKIFKLKMFILHLLFYLEYR